ncbi:MAG: type III-B CRISPR module RAMP protein Cmr4 [Bacteroidia bacterium]|nr:type III-B CRISPR module RAMP protein Cmr4 [Bacteroidia bacterium]MDW8157470.1 type III-B CRISPR module RAMP protein Cmr4 [Bacteroidia bacterium]
MYKIAKPIFLHTLTSLHAGSGDSLGVIDLPIQREKHTGFPKIEASSLKGSLRQAFEDAYDSEADRKKIHLIFGYDGDSLDIKSEKEKYPALQEFFSTKDDREYAGAISFCDARILAFPVRSLKGVFAYVTCPLVLQRLARDLALTGNDNLLPAPPNGRCARAKNNVLIEGKEIVLEEYTFKPINVSEPFESYGNKLTELIFPNSEPWKKWKNKFKEDLVVLEDNEFAEFVRNGTEVITRTKIDNETGTVQEGALFNEEYVPSEAIFYSIVFAGPIFHHKKEKDFNSAEDVMKYFDENYPHYFQIGANATLGKGLVAAHLLV